MDHSNNAERNTRGGSDGLFAVNRVRAEAAAQRANEGTELVILSGLKKKGRQFNLCRCTVGPKVLVPVSGTDVR
jgi:hypothetical protein